MEKKCACMIGINTNLVDLDPLADGINIEEVEAIVNEGVGILGMFLPKYLTCNHYCLTSKKKTRV